MSSPQIFLPKSNRLSLARLWLLVVFMAIALCVFLPRYEPELAGLRWIAGVGVLVWTVFYRQPVSIAVDHHAQTLTYTHANAWGQRRSVTVDLRTASGFYDPEPQGKHGTVWKLVLYNGSYLRNRVSIQENASHGFNKAQLDEVVQWVHRYKRH